MTTLKADDEPERTSTEDETKTRIPTKVPRQPSAANTTESKTSKYKKPKPSIPKSPALPKGDKKALKGNEVKKNVHDLSLPNQRPLSDLPDREMDKKSSPGHNVEKPSSPGQATEKTASPSHGTEKVPAGAGQVQIELLTDRCNDTVRLKLLRAIHEQDMERVQELLREWDATTTMRMFVDVVNDEFPTDLPPTLLAIQMKNTEIATMIIRKEEFHPLTTESCSRDICTCKKKFRKDYGASVALEESRHRIYAYSTLCDPVFMCINNQMDRLDDPILEAFTLSACMKTLCWGDPVYSAEYVALEKRVTQFAVDLLSHCQTNEEMVTVMSETAGADDVFIGGKKQTFSRVYLAVSHQQAEFVAHPNCQQIMRQKWYEGVETWDQWSLLKRAGYIALATILMPFLLVAYMVPALPFVPMMRYPFNKFIFNTVTFVFFLIAASADAFSRTAFSVTNIGSFSRIYMFLWVLGSISRMGKMIYRRRKALKTYVLSSKTRVYDIVMLLVYLVAFLISFLSLPSCPEDAGPRHEEGCTVKGLLGESLLSIGHVMAFGRVLTYFKMFSFLGTLQISVSRMFIDVLRFLIMFVIVYYAFGLGIFKLHHILRVNMESMAKNTSIHVDRITLPSEKSFESVSGTYATLFWSLFGYGEPDAATVAESATHEPAVNDSLARRISYEVVMIVQYTSYILFGAYHVIAVIVLVNMVIAMMANTYNRIEFNKDVEWKFARSRLWMDYFSDYGTLPPPFNLLPFRQIVKFCARIFKRCRPCRPHVKENVKKEQADPHAYKKLMKRLVKRYMRRFSISSVTADAYMTPGRQVSRKVGIYPPTYQRAVSSCYDGAGGW